MLKALAEGVRHSVGLYSNKIGTGSHGLLGGIFPGAVGLPPARGTRDFLRAYSTMPWLRAVTHKISHEVAIAEWKVFVARPSKPGAKAIHRPDLQRLSDYRLRHKALRELAAKNELHELPDHPLLTTLDSANPYLTGLGARKVTQIHLDIVGEAFWMKERGGPESASPERGGRRMPKAVWPIPPHWIMSTPTPDAPFYRVSYRAWQKVIPDTEILWFRDPDPEFPYGRGSGFATALADELETDEFMAKHLKAFYINRARPDLLFSVPGMKASEMQRLQADWLSRLQGYWRAWLPYFINRPFAVEVLEQDARAQQVVQLREHERNVITQVWGLPPEKLGIIENSNRATADAADLIMNKDVVVPRLEFMRAHLQTFFVPEFDERLILDYVSPIQEDREFQLKVAQTQTGAAVRRVDEWREFQGLDPLGGSQGKMFLIPGTFTPTAKLEEPDPMDPMEMAGLTQGAFPDGVGMPGLPKPQPGPGAMPEKPPGNGGPPKPAGPPAQKYRVQAKAFLDAAPESGLMVCWPVPAELASRLIRGVPGAEAAGDLHLTLVYCGKVADVGEAGVARALATVTTVAHSQAPLMGRLGGVGRFQASPTSDGQDVLYASVDVPHLEDLREALVRALTVAGVPVSRDHGFTPHITLAYLSPQSPTPTVKLPDVPLPIQVLRVQAGPEWSEVALASSNGHPVGAVG
jgi:2'-5' RNA ligase